jgi:hypothetical protein
VLERLTKGESKRKKFRESVKKEEWKKGKDKTMANKYK